MDIADFKQQLIVEIENAAHWRSEKEQQYPGDDRNGRCAEALTLLAQSLIVLPEDDPDLRRVWWAWYRPGDTDDAVRMQSMNDIESNLIGRYGFDLPAEGNASDFLRELAKRLNAERMQ